MPRLGIFGAVVGIALLAAPDARAQADQQSIVDRATLTVQDIMGYERNAENALSLLRRARAVMICPRLFRAGFIFGGEGGDCVLVARDGAGSWSSPAFYTMGSGSVGLQIGIQDAQVMMMILTDRGLNAMLDSQFKVGGDASVSFAHLGVGIEGSTTAAAGADIVTLARSRGLYAGLSLEGSLLRSQSTWNQSYYGRDLAARQIVVAMEAHNPGSDPLRSMLIRYSQQAQTGTATPALPPPSAGLGTGRGPMNGATAPGPGRVGQESLPTPPRSTR
ncbi:MAG: putative rane associated protein [Rhodospirillales bacterium]|jgi:lipid-binding SYLF domain-containing protein|nr:putative rane associated protein [Rhodospirillales bacterium]MDB5381888.1 putative rane associated protein [Rhodospirillales bacterium]